jgi:hypothetical protein
MRLHQTKNFSAQQMRQSTECRDNLQRRENICKVDIWWGVNIHNTQGTPKTQQKQANLKMSNRSKYTFYTSNEYMKKMLNITNHQGNTNQNHNRILPHVSENGYCPKD